MAPTNTQELSCPSLRPYKIAIGVVAGLLFLSILRIIFLKVSIHKSYVQHTTVMEAYNLQGEIIRYRREESSTCKKDEGRKHERESIVINDDGEEDVIVEPGQRETVTPYLVGFSGVTAAIPDEKIAKPDEHAKPDESASLGSSWRLETVT